jgi:hypothetical protein
MRLSELDHEFILARISILIYISTVLTSIKEEVVNCTVPCDEMQNILYKLTKKAYKKYLRMS